LHENDDYENEGQAMIKIDALYLLLLIELSFILTGGLTFFWLRSKKYRTLYQHCMKDLAEARQTQEELRKKLSSLNRSTAAAQMPSRSVVQKSKSVPKEDPEELVDLRAKLGAAVEELKTKTSLLEQLQAKFDDLEKEYLILYHQQQKQQADAPSP
jgi:predicted nuclease with TOPRIM domain